MRAAFSRIGSEIWSGSNPAILIAAALLGRRSFLLALAAIAVVSCFKALSVQRKSIVDTVSDTECIEQTCEPQKPIEIRPLFLDRAPPEVRALRAFLASRIVGQHEAIEALIVGLLAGGHVLLEGPPGIAKTLACSTLAEAVDGDFRRVQCTVDLYPSDIIGCEVFDPRNASFRVRRGSIFTNFLLVDEINRAPARTHAALLEAMHDRQVTIGTAIFELSDVFMIVATMNAAEEEGAYPLSAAQLDRFMMMVSMEYPARDEELAVLTRELVSSERRLSLDEIRRLRELSARVVCPAEVLEYAVDLVRATRVGGRGAGPRSTIALTCAARIRAMLEGRTLASINDVRAHAPAVLRHRIHFEDRPLLSRSDREEHLRAIIDNGA